MALSMLRGTAAGPALSQRGARPAPLRPSARPAVDRRPRCVGLRQQQRQRQRGLQTPLSVQSVGESAGPSAISSFSDQDALGPEEEQDFDLLSNKVAELTQELTVELKGCSVYLIGMMGSGKSTVGRMTANTLKYAFFDVDHVIEMAHKGETVADIFSNYGEEYFRNCETQVLRELAPYKNLVVASGGGVVTNPLNWSYMHNGIVAWLVGEPDLLARRVLGDGTQKRPLLHGAGEGAELSPEEQLQRTQEKLTALLDARKKFYQSADLAIPLEGHGQDVEKGAPAPVVMYRLLRAIASKISDSSREREAQRNFKINYGPGSTPPAAGAPSQGVAEEQA